MAIVGQIIRCHTQSAAMQRVADAVLVGLPYFVQGQLPLAKVPGLIVKLTERYPVLARDRHFTFRERRGGKPVQKLITYEHADQGLAWFWLFSSAQDTHERWQMAKTDRPVFWKYELVRQTKAGVAHPVWTWRFSREAYHATRDGLIERIRKHQDRELLAWIEGSKKWPGFAGIRTQHVALGQLLAAEWRRTQRGAEPVPTWPRLRYVRRLKTR